MCEDMIFVLEYLQCSSRIKVINNILYNYRMRDERLKILAKNIKAERVRKGMSQTELAFSVGVSYNTICQIEQARQTPSAFIVFDTANALKIPVEDLFKNIGEKNI